MEQGIQPSIIEVILEKCLHRSSKDWFPQAAKSWQRILQVQFATFRVIHYRINIALDGTIQCRVDLKLIGFQDVYFVYFAQAQPSGCSFIRFLIEIRAFRTSIKPLIIFLVQNRLKFIKKSIAFLKRAFSLDGVPSGQQAT